MDEKKRYFREMKSAGETQDLIANVQEIISYALGQGEQETRDQWFPGWIEEDFEDLLRESVDEGIIDEKYLDELETRK